MRSLVAGITLSALLFFTAGAANANNMPFENFTETWVFFEEGPQGPPQWAIGGFSSGSEQYELFDIEPSVISEEVFGDQQEFLGWEIELTIPNFVDPLPTKSIKVLFEGLNPEPESLPSVLSIVATDTLFGGGPTTQILCPESPDCEQVFAEVTFKEGKDDDPDILKVLEIWELHPNPDWEIVTVFIPVEFEPLSFHVITESFGEVVPEPSSLALVSLGLLGLVVAGRRRN